MSWLRHKFHICRAITVGFYRRCAAIIGFWTAPRVAGAHVQNVSEGHAPIGRRLCIFAHFDRGLALRAHTRRYLAALADQGLSIVFVSNSSLDHESQEYVLSVCSRMIIRKNVGYDFSAYRDSIFEIKSICHDIDILILTNDSVFGPITPLAKLFDSFDFCRADIWGATDSWQDKYHLQSYLLAFGPRTLNSDVFWDFWHRVTDMRSKWSVVKYYEIGFTQEMQRGGLRCCAVFDYHSIIRRAEDIVEKSPKDQESQAATLLQNSAKIALLRASRRQACNPSIDLWLLLSDSGFPFIKRELLRDNPTRQPDISAWHRVMAMRAPELYDEALTYLKTTVRRVAP